MIEHPNQSKLNPSPRPPDSHCFLLLSQFFLLRFFHHNHDWSFHNRGHPQLGSDRQQVEQICVQGSYLLDQVARNFMFHSLGRQLIKNVLQYSLLACSLAWAAWQLHYSPTACRIVRTSYKTFLTSSRALDCTSMSPYVISSDNIFLAPCWKTCIHTFQEIRIFVEHL